MGCGSSSLKGEPVADIGSAPVPVSTTGGGSNLKKTETSRTQFNTVDYDTDRKKSAMPDDRAPHELESPRPSNVVGDEAKLEPYHTIEENADSSAAAYPHEGITPADPSAPRQRAADEPPADDTTPQFISSPDQLVDPEPSGEEPSKKGSSLLAKLKKDEHEHEHEYASGDKKRSSRFSRGGTGANRGQDYDDAELLKYTGLTREQIRARAKKGPGPPDQLQAYANAGIGGATFR